MLSNLDSPSTHFAVGMICSGLLMLPLLFFRFRYWIYLPVVQTLGGVFAEVPDFPRVIGAFPSLGLHHIVDADALYRLLHTRIGDLFFFHRSIDVSGEGNFLQGMTVVICIYNFWIFVFVGKEILQRRRAANP